MYPNNSATWGEQEGYVSSYSCKRTSLHTLCSASIKTAVVVYNARDANMVSPERGTDLFQKSIFSVKRGTDRSKRVFLV